MTHTAAYAAGEWAGLPTWNAPTSMVLPPGASQTYSFRFTLAPSVRSVDETLLALGRPVVFGVPGHKDEK